jgi:hypothetical protein
MMQTMAYGDQETKKAKINKNTITDTFCSRFCKEAEVKFKVTP